MGGERFFDFLGSPDLTVGSVQPIQAFRTAFYGLVRIADNDVFVTFPPLTVGPHYAAYAAEADLAHPLSALLAHKGGRAVASSPFRVVARVPRRSNISYRPIAC
jgi:hypothetical protein